MDISSAEKRNPQLFSSEAVLSTESYFKKTYK